MSRPTEFNPDAVMQPIRYAARLTGLSMKTIRNGCREGTIPHIRIGNDYRVNMPLYIAQLARESRRAIYAEKESSLSS